MRRFRLAASAAAALAALVVAAPAHASRERGHACSLADGLALLRRVLHQGSPDEIVAHSIALGAREAVLELDLGSGRARTVALRGGHVIVDGRQVGDYTPGGALERGWRQVLAGGADQETRDLLAALSAWRVSGLTGADAAAKAQLDAALHGLRVGAPLSSLAQARQPAPSRGATATAPGVIRLADLAALDSVAAQLDAIEASDVADAVRAADVHVGGVTVRPGERLDGTLVVYRGDADVRGEVSGSVIAVFGNVVAGRGARIGGDAVALGGEVLDRGGRVDGARRVISSAELAGAPVAAPAPAPGAARAGSGERRSALDVVFTDVRNVVAIFVACAMLGFGTVFFGRRQLEVVADTARHAFGRALVVGLLGQLLLVPTFAMLVVGLVLTVVGILLVPFAVLAYATAALVALAGGYLAVAHAVGETFTRRRMAHGAFVRAPNAYGYLFTGLVGLLGLWAAAALTGWMGPVVLVFRVAAILVTWLAVTAGFGAVLLSRAGLRDTFAGRRFGEMSDEYLWATPPATPAAPRGPDADR